MMSDDSTLDPSTGLLHRAAFLKEVRKAQSKVPGNLRRGCLLILHFPGLLKIAESDSPEIADETLQSLLAIVESRLRSRDTLGRIAQQSLCVLLRQCREQDAVIIADQYIALLSNGGLDDRLQRAIEELHYRIVPLDPRGRKSRQSLSRVVSNPALTETSKLLSTISSLEVSGEQIIDNVVSLNAESNAVVPASADDEMGGSQHDVTDTMLRAEVGKPSWRLKPGVLLNHKLLVCCHRVQAVGSTPLSSPFSESAIVGAALDCLALSQENTRPLIESQLIIPVDAALITTDAAGWLKDRCRRQRVAPSDICLAMTVESVSKELRSCLPALRRLNRQGIRLMLEGVSAAPQFAVLLKLATFDYVWISAKTLQASLHDVRQRSELDALIVEAHAQQREVCASGIDTQTLLQHAQALQVDIGFGRRCGKTEPFPDLDLTSAHPAR